MTADVRRHDYLRQLTIAYGFEAPLEAALAYTADVAAVVPLRERARAGKLAQDLLALGIAPSQLTDLPQCMCITPFRDAAEALGWIYVVERSALLYESVRRNIVNRLPDTRYATTYLDAGTTAERRLARFGEAVAGYARTYELLGRVEQAAEVAFAQWRAWSAQHQPSFERHHAVR